MAKGFRTERAQALLLAQPWALSLVSAVFVAGMLWLAADAGWDLGAVVGGGRRHAPLWLVLLLGLPLFGAGVVLGAVRQVRLLRRPAAPPVPSPEAERLRREGPGWLSRREDEQAAQGGTGSAQGGTGGTPDVIGSAPDGTDDPRDEAR
ncbi:MULTISPECIES: hypothetical protein [unclassified Rathayibacter]|uniref:hypothetical protein n=1 Tax=unclassified Rathayibacter TaxID=2609250 RepID=UPI000CE796E2|nr:MULTISPECIES: hypothetical protein [unclassified Rathayibacter]PPH29471.1 hypothetical protein C5C94_11725 [Rathayibacter sp. AY1C3]PPI28680.1 hypothetical protein C5D66_14040 [Rathayibacter sp. AY1B4]